MAEEPTITSEDIIAEQRRKKNLAFYEAALFNYFDNEKNIIKQVMTASLLAIGLLVSVLGGKASNWWSFIPWFAANFLFLIVFFILLKNLRIISNLFKELSNYADLLDEDDPIAFSNIKQKIDEITTNLKRYDPWIFRCFGLAIIISVLFVLSTNNFFIKLVKSFFEVIMSFSPLIF